MDRLLQPGQRLTWVQTDSAARAFRLLRDGADVGALRWGSTHGSLATGEAGGSTWSFKRVGVFHPRVTVRKQGEQTDEARVEIGASGKATITFRDGERYVLASNLWRGEWTWQSPSGEALLLTRRDFAMDERAGEVQVLEARLTTMHLPVLALLAWYLVVMLAEDAAATA